MQLPYFMRKLAFYALFFCACGASAQTSNFTYAEITDIHIGRDQDDATGSAIRTINDINKNPDIRFVIITGDISNNGSDEQLYKAKELLDKLNKKYYIIPGNHEEVWSASGGTTFSKLFKTDRFSFQYGGYMFIGTDCGPMLKHGLSHIPQDNLNFIDSVLNNMKDINQPVVFANHYPMTDAMDNSYEAIKRLKKRNIQLILCGHGHSNRKYNFSGIPGIMCRTNLVVKGQGGYNIVNVNDGVFSFCTRFPKADSLAPAWATVKLKRIPKDSIHIDEPDYSINKLNKAVTVKWQYSNELGIAGGFAVTGNYLYSGTYDGNFIALRTDNGAKAWSIHTGGRIYAMPAVYKNRIVFTSTNGYVYCINTTGKMLWKFKSDKAVVSSPNIKDDRVFAGFSDGTFRCFDLQTGKIVWTYEGVQTGFVMASMLYNGKVYFGAWNKNFYALDQKTGKLAWMWTTPRAIAYSPAFLAPVAVNNRIFTVAPDYYINCFDAETGKIVWREKKDDVLGWFSRGLSKDSAVLYIKSRNNTGVGLATHANNMNVIWKAPLNMQDDACITPIVDDGQKVYFSSNNGVIIATSPITGKTLWEYKFTNSPFNMLMPVGTQGLYVSTVDGKIARLNIGNN